MVGGFLIHEPERAIEPLAVVLRGVGTGTRGEGR
jgi:hypothetical protein